MKKIQEKIINYFNIYVEKYSKVIKLDLEYFIKGGFWLGISQTSNVLKGLILSILFANFLPKEIYGQYSFIFASLGIAMVFSLQGLNNSIIEAINRKYDGTYYKSLKLIFKWSFLGSIFLVGVGLYTLFIFQEKNMLIFLTLALLFPFFSISPQYINFFLGKKDFRTLSKLNIIFNLVSTFIIFILVIIKTSLFILVLTIILLHIVIQNYFSLILVKKYIKNKKVSKSSISFGKKISFLSLLEIGVKNIDKYVIPFFLGFEALAIYIVVYAIPGALLSFSVIVKQLVFNKQVFRQIELRNLKKILLFNLSMILIGFLLNFIFFQHIYSKYLDYYSLSYISYFILLFGLGELFYSQKLANKKTKDYYKMSLIFYSLGALIFIILTPFGLLYAIIAKILYRFLYFLIGIIFTFDLEKKG